MLFIPRRSSQFLLRNRGRWRPSHVRIVLLNRRNKLPLCRQPGDVDAGVDRAPLRVNICTRTNRERTICQSKAVGRSEAGWRHRRAGRYNGYVDIYHRNRVNSADAERDGGRTRLLPMSRRHGDLKSKHGSQLGHGIGNSSAMTLPSTGIGSPPSKCARIPRESGITSNQSETRKCDHRFSGLLEILQPASCSSDAALANCLRIPLHDLHCNHKQSCQNRQCDHILITI